MHGRDRREESNRQSMRGCLWLKTTVGGGGEKDFKNLSGNIWKQRNFDGEGAELVGCLQE